MYAGKRCAARIAIGKSLRGSEPALAEINAAGLADAPAALSPIPTQTGKAAFAAREAELLAGSSTFMRKGRLVMRQIREIRRIIATPMKDLHL